MLKITDVAARLNVSGETVRRWLLSGQLHGFHAGRKGVWRIHPDELERFLAGPESQG